MTVRCWLRGHAWTETGRAPATNAVVVLEVCARCAARQRVAIMTVADHVAVVGPVTLRVPGQRVRHRLEYEEAG